MMEEKTDKALYLEFLNHNQSSFEKIVIRYKDNLIYFIQRYVKGIAIAEDIAQDVFVYVLEHKEKYNFKYSLKTYLYMIAKSRAINYLHYQKRFQKIETIEQYETDESLESIIYTREEFRNLKQQLESLKPEKQLAIYLIDFEGLSYQEASKILKKSLSRLKSNIT